LFHAAIFAALPEVMAVHAHAEDTLPVGINKGRSRRGSAVNSSDCFC